MKQKKHISLEQGMYFFGIVIFFLAVFFVVYLKNVLVYKVWPDCFLYSYFGIYCPGCGGTRAVMALLEGRIWDSIYYHPIVVYTAIIYLVFMIPQTIHYISRGKIKGIRFRYWFLYGALVVIIINFLVKNIFKFIYGINLI